MKTHKDLDVWKESMSLITAVYQRTSSFPKCEIYGITNQIRRASVSVSINISEGYGRGRSRELKYFLRVSMGSLMECETLVIISRNLGYLDDIDYAFFKEKIRVITAQITGLIRYTETCNQSHAKVNQTAPPINLVTW